MVGEHGHTGAYVVCAWGVDVDEHTLRKSKRKNLLVSHQEILTLLILTNSYYFGAQIVKIVRISKNSQK